MTSIVDSLDVRDCSVSELLLSVDVSLDCAFELETVYTRFAWDTFIFTSAFFLAVLFPTQRNRLLKFESEFLKISSVASRLAPAPEPVVSLSVNSSVLGSTTFRLRLTTGVVEMAFDVDGSGTEVDGYGTEVDESGTEVDVAGSSTFFCVIFSADFAACFFVRKIALISTCFNFSPATGADFLETKAVI